MPPKKIASKPAPSPPPEEQLSQPERYASVSPGPSVFLSSPASLSEAQNSSVSPVKPVRGRVARGSRRDDAAESLEGPSGSGTTRRVASISAVVRSHNTRVQTGNAQESDVGLKPFADISAGRPQVARHVLDASTGASKSRVTAKGVGAKLSADAQQGLQSAATDNPGVATAVSEGTAATGVAMVDEHTQDPRAQQQAPSMIFQVPMAACKRETSMNVCVQTVHQLTCVECCMCVCVCEQCRLFAKDGSAMPTTAQGTTLQLGVHMLSNVRVHIVLACLH